MNPSTHKTYLDIAEKSAQFSKCRAFKMCALIVKNGKLVSMGMNGTASKMPNCCDVFPEFDPIKDVEIRKQHHEWSSKFEIHAELNAILNAANEGIRLNGATMYITNLCCSNCLKHIVGAGIKRVIYRGDYDKGASEEERKEYRKIGIEILQFAEGVVFSTNQNIC